jgi:hypothetical protein
MSKQLEQKLLIGNLTGRQIGRTFKIYTEKKKGILIPGDLFELVGFFAVFTHV